MHTFAVYSFNEGHVKICTDGSSTGGTNAGRTATVATVGDTVDLVIIHTSSSYEEEKVFLFLAL